MRYTEYRKLLKQFVAWQQEKGFLSEDVILIPYEFAEMFLEDLHDAQMAELEDGNKKHNHGKA